MSKLLGSLLKTASTLPQAGQAGKVAAVAVGTVAAVQVAGTVARKVAEKKANAQNPAAAGGASGSAAPQPEPHLSRKERRERREELLKQAISGHGFTPGTNPYARANGASGAFSTTDTSPTNQRQAREQIVAWADLGLYHLTAFYAENKGKLNEKAEEKLWYSIEVLGKASMQNRQYGNDATLEELKGQLATVKALASSYRSSVPKDQRRPDPVVTQAGIASANAALSQTPYLDANVQWHVNNSQGECDVRDVTPGISPAEEGRKQDLQVTVGEALLKMCELRQLTMDPETLKLASEAEADPKLAAKLQAKIGDMHRLNAEALTNLEVLSGALSDSHGSIDALSNVGNDARKLVKQMRDALQPVKDGQVLQTTTTIKSNGEVGSTIKPV